ncbi:MULTISPECIES: hypothetical protein [unclassified Actinoplanes]|uniref:hypothetical protein n=1 Tax=unclassified Actinoplanes TaxID=2626549 RepID=UPI0012BAE86F|nr:MULTISPECIES: hypothetical protein [unclassified Actinoplanes]
MLGVELAAYTSAWYVRHPDGALSAKRSDAPAPAPAEPAESVAGRAAAAAAPERAGGRKVLVAGPE